MTINPPRELSMEQPRGGKRLDRGAEGEGLGSRDPTHQQRRLQQIKEGKSPGGVNTTEEKNLKAPTRFQMLSDEDELLRRDGDISHPRSPDHQLGGNIRNLDA